MLPEGEGFEQKLLSSDMEETSAKPASRNHSEEAESVERVLKQLTLQEKVFCLSGRSMWTAGGVPRLKLDPLRVSDGPHGMRGFCLHGDSGALLAPCEMAMAATFDEDLIEGVGTLLGEDCARRGGHVLLGPCINLQRTPLFGRHFECFSEDPYLTARATVAYVKGVQNHVAACAKHFVCNDQEDDRHTMNAVIDERTLREVYLAPFEAAVKEGDVESIMCGYNRVNGSFCSENSWILQSVLREEWKYRGWLISDWFGNQSTVPAITAGLNIEMPGIEPRHFGGYLLDACKQGSVTEDLLDQRCRPVLRTMLRHSGKPAPGAPTRPPDSNGVNRRRSIMHRAAAASHVLLKNDNNVLPLDPGATRRIAVIGPCAGDTTIQGGGSSRVRPRICKSILEALREALPRGSVVYEPGCYVGDLPHTTPEFEALKPIAACNAAGQPLGFRIAAFFDLFLHFASWASNIECFRRYLMPCLRVLGLRQSDPVKAAQAEAKRGRPPPGHAPPSSLHLGSPLVCCCSFVVAALGGLFAAGVFTQDRPRLRAAAGILAFGIVAAQVHRIRSQHVKRRQDEKHLQDAEVTAKDVDAVILVLGSTGFIECEGMDRSNMHMSGRQDELAQRVAAAARGPVIVVLNVGSPKELPWLSSVSSVLLVHYGGEEMAAAVADTLLGVSCPAGRLPMTWPRRLEEAPVVRGALLADSGSPMNSPGFRESTTLLGAPTAKPHTARLPGETVYTECLRIGYRAYGEGGIMGTIAPLFPFGFGLSYTAFEYGPLEVEVARKCADDSGPLLVLRVSVRNTGNISGAEVPQVYTEATWPGSNLQKLAPGPRSLCSFARTAELAPGEEKRVVFELGSRALGAAYSAEAGSWFNPRAGHSVRIDVGGSSADVRSSTTVVLE